MGIFWRVFELKTLLYILAIWNILRPMGTFYGNLVIFSSFGIFFLAMVHCSKKNLASLLATLLRLCLIALFLAFCTKQGDRMSL
jgi:hypothetical protein